MLKADLQRELEHKQRILQELTDRDKDEVRPKKTKNIFNQLLTSNNTFNQLL